jgi:hypothetical protein
MAECSLTDVKDGLHMQGFVDQMPSVSFANFDCDIHYKYVMHCDLEMPVLAVFNFVFR